MRPLRQEEAEGKLMAGLKESPLFYVLGVDQLGKVARTGELQEFAPNETIVHEGDIATNFYLIIEGQVEIQQAKRSLTRLGRGQFFGETSLLVEQTRSADVIALERTICLVLSNLQLRRLIGRTPSVALKLLEESTRRYRPRPVESPRPEQTFEFESPRAKIIFDQLVSDFLTDYMSKNYLQEKSGWRTIGEIAKETRIPVKGLYSSSGGPASPLRELLKRGVIEMRVSPGERGRGGQIMKFRVAYEKEPIKEYVKGLSYRKGQA